MVKVLVPSSSETLVNLQIDATSYINGAASGAGVGDGGKTGAIMVSAGTTAEPGDDHDVGETWNSGFLLSSYVKDISCVDRDLPTFNGGDPLTMDGAGPLTVPVDPDDDIVCTITNTNVCESNTCDLLDTFCADFECLPSGEIGNCADVTYTPATTICNPGSGDICDPDESCTGDSASLPG